VLGRAGDQLAMINEIMQTTRLEARTITAHHEFFDLRDFLDQLRSGYEVRPDKKDVRLVWDYPAAAMPITSDCAKLKQILHNLINNALKFTDEGTVTVSVRVRGQELGVGDQGLGVVSNPQPPIPNPRFIEFRVTDTGIGIPKEMQEAIFNKFHQMDSSETRLYGGVGLGLYIVKNFTDLLGGKVDVESEVGKGTTFTVTIPLEP
jgi:signal transduction histidine kinase